MHERVHWLIDRIYAAALDPEVWQEVTEGVSELFGGSPTMLGFALPGEEQAGPRYAVGIEPEYRQSYLQHLYKDVPWSNRYNSVYLNRWGDMGEVLGHLNLADTGLYTEWMKPQGFAPYWPVGCTIGDEQDEPVGGFSVWRREGEPPIDKDDLAAAEVFMPHLRRAVQVHVTLHDARRVRLALGEALDRLPTGLLLLDAKRRIVMRNAGADRILESDDGFRIDRGGPTADDARENATLQKLIADAMEARAGMEIRAAGFVAVSRPSGKRSYAIMVTPLLQAPGNSIIGDAVVAIFVADPGARVVAAPEALTELYQLTNSEAELVRLLASGLSLEEAAERRGISLNTARSHLKHAFAKTDTSRQGELVRLIVTGLGQIGEG